MRCSSQQCYALLTAVVLAASLAFFAPESFAQTEPSKRAGAIGSGGKKVTRKDKNSKISDVPGGRQRIEGYLAYIEDRMGQMKSSYYYGNAVKTLEAAFANNGVSGKAMPYAVEWGNNGVYTAWDSASKFYNHHSNALKESMSAIRTTSAANQSDLAYIDRGMEEWKRLEGQLQERFQTLVATYTGRAVNADRRFAVSDKYAALRAEASNQRNSDRYNALNIEEAEVMKPLNLERGRLEAQQESERGGIDEIAAMRLFEALRPRTTSRPGNTGRSSDDARLADGGAANQPQQQNAPAKKNNPHEWRAVELETFPYGNDKTKKSQLDKLIEVAKKLLDKISPKSGTLAQTLPKAFSATKAVDVYITYACVDVKTETVRGTKVILLDDDQALPWWAKTEANFKQLEKDRATAIQKNKPKGGCPPS